ncbi:MAG TPA: hypothetical protein VGN31_12130 [Paraburkholderia sp.]|jgi:hypothetical protein
MQDELNFRDIAAQLPASPSFLTGGDLWPRIAAAHLARRRTRRIRNVAAGGIVLTLLISASVFFSLPSPHESPAVDWQARAQALEIQLNEAIASAPAGTPSASDAEVDLARVDRALQAAYDRGARKNELLPLWKQRSDLLSLLLAVHQQQLALTRI